MGLSIDKSDTKKQNKKTPQKPSPLLTVLMSSVIFLLSLSAFDLLKQTLQVGKK